MDLLTTCFVEAPNYLASCWKVLSLQSSLRWDFVASELSAIARINDILKGCIKLIFPKKKKTFLWDWNKLLHIYSWNKVFEKEKRNDQLYDFLGAILKVRDRGDRGCSHNMPAVRGGEGKKDFQIIEFRNMWEKKAILSQFYHLLNPSHKVCIFWPKTNKNP